MYSDLRNSLKEAIKLSIYTKLYNKLYIKYLISTYYLEKRLIVYIKILETSSNKKIKLTKYFYFI